MLKRISLLLLIILYIGAGINHFWHPTGYLSIIPPYLPYHEAINYISGIAELTFAVLLIFSATRRFAAYGIAVMLVAFIPAHIYMIQKGGCMGTGGALYIPAWLAWVRLFPLQFILIWWALFHAKAQRKIQKTK